MREITDAVAIIEAKLSELGGFASSFVEVRDNGREIILGANEAGLLQLTLHLLTLAGSNADGSHVHLDEHSGADVAERALVLRRSHANEA
ncbi:hypothetical protein ACFFGH_34255 [Lysobacter korlensis]|uniref:Uncharacterized protein n=1 Tax=Lysobacter korlensis TaxID=553636 RepID=A0ABV6S112_9GAMM